MKILKFGGRSLSNGKGLSSVLKIIQEEAKNGPITVVVSARNNATDLLEQMLEKAKNGKSFTQELAVFKRDQLQPHLTLDIFKEFSLLKTTLEAIKVLGDSSQKTQDLILAQGEIIAVKLVNALLKKAGLNPTEVIATQLFETKEIGGTHQIVEIASQIKTTSYFKTMEDNQIPIVTGFIASNNLGQVTTLGRNGSNYSASLLAQFLKAEEVRSYTNVDGVFTANPDQVTDAQSISQLSYAEAQEMANFGASILHEKTIYPLIPEQIPLVILNTFNPKFKGTVIHNKSKSQGVTSISIRKNVSLIHIEGNGLLGKIGVDARIFESLQRIHVSIGVVSQGSTERGISFIVPQEEASKSVSILTQTFEQEINRKEIDSIRHQPNVSTLTLVGQSLHAFSTALKSLSSHQIPIELITHTARGKNISLVISDDYVTKASNLIHSQIVGVSKKINIAIFGKGLVGTSLILQILKSRHTIEKRKGIQLNIFAIAGRNTITLQHTGVSNHWNKELKPYSGESSIEQVIAYAKKNHLENLIAIDNTASPIFIQDYPKLIKSGFDLISSNKLANTQPYSNYKELRKILDSNGKKYLYETNVGAGLPLIDTIKLLHDSGENITRIKGIFSGSLSFLFNQYSEREESFSNILKEAIRQGFTEPDPREDLSGNDVARKLLILARELDLENELSDIEIQSLVPSSLGKYSPSEFLDNLDGFNPEFSKIKTQQKPNHVLRYVGELFGDLQKSKGKLKVQLLSVPKASALGQVSGSDSIIEIYTESYGKNPIVIQGAGAGAEVTARGVFGDLLRISDKK